ncbi:MAG: RNase adapter RapZ [Desulfovibrio sp.]|uniref:RNase adapter RapZ n=1 Tax=Desulfovibrio sp. 7SRBS1 TaxID=3378064 RepID=UPI003B4258A2
MTDEDATEKLTVVILSGLSGAGKSTALHVFEDIGFFCVDGLPASMIPRLVELYSGQGGEGQTRYKGLALGMDIRQRDFLKTWRATEDELFTMNISLHLLYLEAEETELTRRYHQTRRPHPLESADMGLQPAMEEERNLLEPLRTSATLVLDTTHYSIHDLRRTLQEKWSFLRQECQGMRIHVISFGFKHGQPKEADCMFDLRFLPNPYFDPSLRPLSGKDPAIAEYVLGSEVGSGFASHLKEFICYMVPLYAKEGRYRLTLAFGCTGGRHRSVATAEMIFSMLKEMKYSVTLEHRHIERV